MKVAIKMQNTIQLTQIKLFDLKDQTYKEFQCKLIPTIAKENVIGVRMPTLRNLQKELNKLLSQDELSLFFNDLPHEYYDENNLHGLFINDIRNFDICISHLNQFAPYIDNWATCDLISPKIFQSNTENLEKHILTWLHSEQAYIIRLGITILLKFYLDTAFDVKYLDWVAAIQSDEYYVNMAIAWFFATALTKQYNNTISYIENQSLPDWIHKKIIQKAIESYRIDEETKRYLRSLK